MIPVGYFNERDEFVRFVLPPAHIGERARLDALRAQMHTCKACGYLVLYALKDDIK